MIIIIDPALIVVVITIMLLMLAYVLALIKSYREIAVEWQNKYKIAKSDLNNLIKELKK